MTEQTHSPVRISGDDVILRNTGSDQWVEWTLKVHQSLEAKENQIIQTDILLMEDDHGHCSKLIEDIDAQLDGAEPTLINDLGQYEYALGFSEEHAQELKERLEAVVKVGAQGHCIELQLSQPTFEQLAKQLGRQWLENND